MTTITLPNMDVRHVSNAMRTMITDANTQLLLPVGNAHSIAIVGFGDQLSAFADMLRAADAASARHQAPGTGDGARGRTARECDRDGPRITARPCDRRAPAARRRGAERDAVHDHARGDVQVLTDERTNSLLITGSQDRIGAIKELVALLDV